MQLSRKSAVKIIPQPLHRATLEHNCVHWPKKAGLLSSSHQPCTILCLSCSSCFWHPALWILPWFSPTVTIALTPSCVPINIYLALLPCLLPLQAHGPCFSLPTTCGSLKGSPALLSCRNKHVPGEQLIAYCHLSRKALACTCPKLLLKNILKISAHYGR